MARKAFSGDAGQERHQFHVRNFAPRGQTETRQLTAEQWRRMKASLRDLDAKVRQLLLAEREQ